jgi:pyruvate dehydrogenase E1 component alpha subunit
VAAESDELAARLRDYCTSMPVPGPDRIFSEVYAEPSAPLEAQREEFLAYHDSFADAATSSSSGCDPR